MMDKYLELIKDEEKYIESLKKKIAFKEKELIHLDNMLEMEKSQKERNEKEKKTINKDLSLLKKYDGKKIIIENIKEFWQESKKDFKNRSPFNKMAVCFLLILYIVLCIIIKNPIFFIVNLLLLSLVIYIPWFLPEVIKLKKLRKNTSITKEEEKLEYLAKELDLIKNKISQIKTAKEKDLALLSSLYIEKSSATVDISAINKLRESQIAKLIDLAKLDESFYEEPKIEYILKRKRKE